MQCDIIQASLSILDGRKVVEKFLMIISIIALDFIWVTKIKYLGNVKLILKYL